MTPAQLLAQSTELTDLFKTGGPFAAGAAAVLIAGRVGWIRFPPSPEQTATQVRLEKMTDDLISRQSTSLADQIVATKTVTSALETNASSLSEVVAAVRANTEEMTRLAAAVPKRAGDPGRPT